MKWSSNREIWSTGGSCFLRFPSLLRAHQKIPASILAQRCFWLLILFPYLFKILQFKNFFHFFDLISSCNNRISRARRKYYLISKRESWGTESYEKWRSHCQPAAIGCPHWHTGIISNSYHPSLMIMLIILYRGINGKAWGGSGTSPRSQVRWVLTLCHITSLE